jgi:phosphatidylinositol glycan class K
VDPSVPRSKRLLTDERSNVFVYMTGHGGNEFLKFQDNEEISAHDIADAFEQMYQKKRSVSYFPSDTLLTRLFLLSNRYNEIFFMIDTCQANTMYTKFYSPNILATGSSMLDESSYSASPFRWTLHFPTTNGFYIYSMQTIKISAWQ